MSSTQPTRIVIPRWDHLALQTIPDQCEWVLAMVAKAANPEMDRRHAGAGGA